MKRILILIVIILFGLCISGCKQEKEENKDDNILTTEEIGNMETIFKDYYISKGGNKEGILAKNFKIMHYFGKYRGAYVVVIANESVSSILPVPGDRYGVYARNKMYTFTYLPQPISVFYDNQYYLLNSKEMFGFFTEDEMDMIYNRFCQIFEED